MRRFALFALASILLGVAQPASACISYNRTAELAVVDEAIAAPKTKTGTKEKLVALRADMVATDRTAIENAARYNKAVTEAFKILGKQRIRNNVAARPGVPIPRGAPAPQDGKFVGFVGCG